MYIERRRIHQFSKQWCIVQGLSGSSVNTKMRQGRLHYLRKPLSSREGIIDDEHKNKKHVHCACEEWNHFLFAVKDNSWCDIGRIAGIFFYSVHLIRTGRVQWHKPGLQLCQRLKQEKHRFKTNISTWQDTFSTQNFI